jgi:hypothetical protein
MVEFLNSLFPYVFFTFSLNNQNLVAMFKIAQLSLDFIKQARNDGSLAAEGSDDVNFFRDVVG